MSSFNASLPQFNILPFQSPTTAPRLQAPAPVSETEVQASSNTSITKMSIAHLVDSTFERVINESPTDKLNDHATALTSEEDDCIIVEAPEKDKPGKPETREWSPKEIRILYNCMSIDGPIEKKYAIASSIMLTRSAVACKQYWKNNKEKLINDPKLIALYGKVEIDRKLRSWTQEHKRVLYSHMTYVALPSANLKRAASELHKSYAICKQVWNIHKDEWEKNETLKAIYGAINSKPLPQKTTTTTTTSTTQNTRRTWSRDELEILYEEMSYIGPVKLNYEMASARLTDRSPETCKTNWHLNKKTLLEDFELEKKFGKPHSRSREGHKIDSDYCGVLSFTTKPNNSPANPPLPTIPHNAALTARPGEFNVFVEQNESVANMVQDIAGPIWSTPPQPPITYIQNQWNVSLYPPVLQNTPLTTNSFESASVENNSPWQPKEFEALIYFMIACEVDYEKLRNATLDLRNRSTVQRLKMWDQRVDYILQYMTFLISQPGYRSWSEEENNAFDEMLNSSDQIYIILKNISLVLNRPFLECFAKWEIKKFEQMNAPVQSSSQNPMSVQMQSQEAPGLNFLLEAIAKSSN